MPPDGGDHPRGEEAPGDQGDEEGPVGSPSDGEGQDGGEGGEVHGRPFQQLQLVVHVRDEEPALVPPHVEEHVLQVAHEPISLQKPQEDGAGGRPRPRGGQAREPWARPPRRREEEEGPVGREHSRRGRRAEEGEEAHGEA